MNARENDPSLSECPFHGGGGSVRVVVDNCAPARKLRSVLPILIERMSTGIRNRDRRLPDTPRFGSVEPKPRTCSQIQSVVGRVAGNESTRADSQIVQPIMYRVMNIQCAGCRQAVTDGFEIPARNDEQTISPELWFAHRVQPWRVDRRIIEMVVSQDFLATSPEEVPVPLNRRMGVCFRHYWSGKP